MLHVVSAVLAIARSINGLTIPELAYLVGVTEDDVFNAENFLNDAPMLTVWRIADFLGVNLDQIQEEYEPLQ